MKRIIALTTAATFCLISQMSGSAYSADFKLTVTVPALVGVNVFPTHDQGGQEKLLAPKTTPLPSQEQVLRDGEKILLQTVTVR